MFTLLPLDSVATGGLGKLVANLASCQDAVLLNAGAGAGALEAGEQLVAIAGALDPIFIPMKFSYAWGRSAEKSNKVTHDIDGIGMSKGALKGLTCKAGLFKRKDQVVSLGQRVEPNCWCSPVLVPCCWPRLEMFEGCV